MSIITREEQKQEDMWDLAPLFADIPTWDKAFADISGSIDSIATYQGTLGESKEQLHACLKALHTLELEAETVGHYAYLQYQADATDPEHQRMLGEFTQFAGKFNAAASYITPELLAIDDEKIQGFTQDPIFDDFRIMLQKILRGKPHVLTLPEEQLLAEQSTLRGTNQNAFAALTNSDMDFGSITVGDTEEPLSHGTYAKFMIHPDRKVREQAYNQYYKVFDNHKQTISTLFAGNVDQDCTLGRIRKHSSAREAALFPDKVPVSVYDNLISVVHENLPTLHRYYEIRKKILGVSELRHYDVYAPLVADVTTHYPYEKGVETITKALAPLGDEYTSTLNKGLLDGWVDRYENKGKRSGAFSYGCFIGYPYILMNYQERVLGSLFTLAHEGGHSMHSWYSAKNNPFPHYNYTIFEAEVASTFNEKLLGHYLMQETDSKDMKAYLINKELDSFVATLFRQTMFAEFEHKTHALHESGTALTLDVIRSTYRELLEQYFGPALRLEEVSDLECLRIPHFYSAFYVYKYATGLSASIALSQKVLHGDKSDLEQYLNFLKSGGSKYPLDALRAAGVDMETTAPTEAAMKRFTELLDQFEQIMM